MRAENFENLHVLDFVLKIGKTRQKDLLKRRHINNCTIRCMINSIILLPLFRKWLTYTTSNVQSRVSLIIRELFVNLNSQFTFSNYSIVVPQDYRSDQFNSDDSDFVKLGALSRGRYVDLHFAHLTRAENLQQILFSFLATVFILKRSKSIAWESSDFPNKNDRWINSSITDRRWKSCLLALCLFINIYKKETMKISRVRSGKISARIKSLYIL